MLNDVVSVSAPCGTFGRTNQRTNERTDKAFLGVGRFLNVVGFRLQSCLFSSSNLESLNQKTSFKHYYCFTHSTRGASIT